MFETVDSKRLWGAIVDLPITRGYATLGDGVLEYLDAQGVRCRLIFSADDLQVGHLGTRLLLRNQAHHTILQSAAPSHAPCRMTAAGTEPCCHPACTHAAGRLAEPAMPWYFDCLPASMRSLVPQSGAQHAGRPEACTVLWQAAGEETGKLVARDRVSFQVATRIKAHQAGQAVGGAAAQHAGEHGLCSVTSCAMPPCGLSACHQCGSGSASKHVPS